MTDLSERRYKVSVDDTRFFVSDKSTTQVLNFTEIINDYPYLISMVTCDDFIKATVEIEHERITVQALDWIPA